MYSHVYTCIHMCIHVYTCTHAVGGLRTHTCVLFTQLLFAASAIIYMYIYVYTFIFKHVHVYIKELVYTFVDGYCSTVQGLLDWFEVDLGFTELSNSYCTLTGIKELVYTHTVCHVYTTTCVYKRVSVHTHSVSCVCCFFWPWAQLYMYMCSHK